MSTFRHFSQLCVIVKYGGSAITKKSKFETLKREVLIQTADQVEAIRRRNSQVQFVIIHGAGSFGHFQAHEYDLRSGGGDDWCLGLSKTRQSVTKLNHIVTAAHCDAGIPAVSVSLFPNAICHNKNLVEPGPLAELQSILDAGLVPVIHGDVVFDSARNCAVYGGDSILLWTVKHFCAKMKRDAAAGGQPVELPNMRVVFLTDVAGVYDKPPLPAGKFGASANGSSGQCADASPALIDEIGVDSDGHMMLSVQHNSLTHDVTGGIKTKLQCAANIVRECGVDVLVVQAGTSHAHRAMSGDDVTSCVGERWIGTRISPSQSNL